MNLSDAEVERYSRQILLPGVGEEGQLRLKAARVRLAGRGPRADAALLYLASAGVGTLWVDDGDSTGAATARAANHWSRVEPWPGSGADALLLLLPRSDREPGASQFPGLRSGGGQIPTVAVWADAGGGGVVALAPGGPCLRCAIDGIESDGASVPALDLSLGALAALELTLLVMGLAPGPGAGRRHPSRRLDLRGGAIRAAPLTPRPDCHCGRYPEALVQRLVALAEADPHREVCGFVARWPDGGLDPIPVENALPWPLDRAGYRMDPIGQLRAMQAIDRRGGEIAAVFHSHPEAGAELSDRDREKAAVGGTQMVPGADQLVLGMRGGRVFEARCHPQPKRGSAPTQTVG